MIHRFLSLIVLAVANEHGFATIPATASNLGAMDAAALRRTAWDSKLKEDSVRPSIFSMVKTVFKLAGDVVIIKKAGLLLDVSNVGKRTIGGGQSVRIAIRTPMREAPREGTGEDQLGYEDETDLLYTELYYNEIKKSVRYNTYGYDYNDTEYLNYVEGYTAYMGTFWAELHDHRYQMALFCGFSNELTKAPTSQVQTFNPNWAVPNVATASYPTWDPDAITVADGAIDAEYWYPNRAFSGAGTFVENIAASCMAGAGTGATSNAVLDVDAIYEICNYIQDQHIVEPLADQTYIWKWPLTVLYWALNPNNTNSLGAYWEQVSSYQDKAPMLPGEVGMLAGIFRIVKDFRCPTMVIGGAAGSYTITPGWIRPGNNDDRNNGAWSNVSGNTNYAFDMTAIMGAQCLAKYTRDEMKGNLIETTEYGKREGRGSYMGDGIMIPRYDKGTQSATSLIYRGSCLVPVSRRRVAST